MSPQTTACSTTTGYPASSSATRAASAIPSSQLLEVVERLVDGADHRPGHAAGVVQLAQQEQVLEVRRGFQLAAHLRRQLALAVQVGVHVVLDEKLRPLG